MAKRFPSVIGAWGAILILAAVVVVVVVAVVTR